MKTKDFIEMLQREDPSGECHIRMEGGIPQFAIRNPGYWDGSYSYIDEEGNYVTSESGSKIDIYCMDIDLFVENQVQKGLNLDQIKSKFKFDFTSLYEDRNKNKAEKILEKVEKSYNDEMEISEMITKNKKQNEN